MSSENVEIHMWLKKFTKVAQKLLKGPKVAQSYAQYKSLLKTSKVAKKLSNRIYISLDRSPSRSTLRVFTK